MNRAARFGTEAAYGTAVATSDYLALVGESLKRKPTLRAIRPERRHSPIRQIETRRSVSGNLDVYLDYDQLGTILRRLVGVPTSAFLANGGWHHYFGPRPDFTPPSLTIDIARDVELHRYTGVVFQAARLSMTTQDRHFGLSLSCIGKDEAPAGAIPTPAMNVFPEPAFIGQSDAPDTLLVILSDGTTTWQAHAESLDLNFTWDRKLRTPERRITPTGFYGGGVINATGKIGTLYGTDSDFLLDAIRSRALVSLRFIMNGASIGPFFDHETLEIVFPVCQVNGDPPTLKNSGRGNIDFSVDLGVFYTAPSTPGFVLETSVSSNLIVNPGDEDGLTGGNPTGWTHVGGVWAQYAGSVPGDPVPQAGSFYFARRTNASSAELYQDVSLATYASQIDAAVVSGLFSGYYSSLDQDASPPNFSSDTARIILEYRNAVGTVLSSFDTGEVQSHGNWALAEDTRTIPALTRSVRVRLITVLYNGTVPNGYFDSLSFQVSFEEPTWNPGSASGPFSILLVNSTPSYAS